MIGNEELQDAEIAFSELDLDNDGALNVSEVITFKLINI
jgi:Ca2+-binding EF-hand superfamily protein